MEKQYKNEMKLVFPANSQNEAFARTVAAAFVVSLNPTLEEISDIKTAVSEAVTNAVIHGYEKEAGLVTMSCRIEKEVFSVEILDEGCGIKDIEQAMEPMYTTKGEEERSGMGFTFMEAFMDHLSVVSEPGKGTRVLMEKRIRREE